MCGGVFTILCACPFAPGVAWSFFKENFGVIAAKFAGGQSFIISGVVKGVCSGFKTVAAASQSHMITSLPFSNRVPKNLDWRCVFHPARDRYVLAAKHVSNLE